MQPIAEVNFAPNMMAQLELHETPLRIQSPQKTYYVLSVEQILALMVPIFTSNNQESFTPQDFGITEEDVTCYLELRQKRQEQLGSIHHVPLSTDLQRRLDMMRSSRDSDESLVDEQALKELEDAMMHNLQLSVQNFQK